MAQVVTDIPLAPSASHPTLSSSAGTSNDIDSILSILEESNDTEQPKSTPTHKQSNSKLRSSLSSISTRKKAMRNRSVSDNTGMKEKKLDDIDPFLRPKATTDVQQQHKTVRISSDRLEGDSLLSLTDLNKIVGQVAYLPAETLPTSYFPNTLSKASEDIDVLVGFGSKDMLASTESSAEGVVNTDINQIFSIAEEAETKPQPSSKKSKSSLSSSWQSLSKQQSNNAASDSDGVQPRKRSVTVGTTTFGGINVVTNVTVKCPHIYNSEISEDIDELLLVGNATEASGPESVPTEQDIDALLQVVDSSVSLDAIRQAQDKIDGKHDPAAHPPRQVHPPSPHRHKSEENMKAAPVGTRQNPHPHRVSFSETYGGEVINHHETLLTSAPAIVLSVECLAQDIDTVLSNVEEKPLEETPGIPYDAAPKKLSPPSVYASALAVSHDGSVAGSLSKVDIRSATGSSRFLNRPVSVISCGTAGNNQSCPVKQRRLTSLDIEHFIQVSNPEPVGVGDQASKQQTANKNDPNNDEMVGGIAEETEEELAPLKPQSTAHLLTTSELSSNHSNPDDSHHTASTGSSNASSDAEHKPILPKSPKSQTIEPTSARSKVPAFAREQDADSGSRPLDGSSSVGSGSTGKHRIFQSTDRLLHRPRRHRGEATGSGSPYSKAATAFVSTSSIMENSDRFTVHIDIDELIQWGSEFNRRYSPHTQSHHNKENKLL
ncbi:hypothetical protein HK102_013804 [Quaeritorhiza haematococci]|nr:hypothetical protein HK102_013804 [Quaeritorhiza haematococci]